MKKLFKNLSLLTFLLVSGISMINVPVNAVSDETIKITNEMIEVLDKAEKNLEETKKQLEEALEEYFAASRLCRLNNPIYKHDPGPNGTTIAKTYKENIQHNINTVYRLSMDNSKTSKSIYSQNLDKIS